MQSNLLARACAGGVEVWARAQNRRKIPKQFASPHEHARQLLTWMKAALDMYLSTFRVRNVSGI